jgi:hypothetical protein
LGGTGADDLDAELLAGTTERRVGSQTCHLLLDGGLAVAEVDAFQIAVQSQGDPIPLDPGP